VGWIEVKGVGETANDEVVEKKISQGVSERRPLKWPVTFSRGEKEWRAFGRRIGEQS